MMGGTKEKLDGEIGGTYDLISLYTFMEFLKIKKKFKEIKIILTIFYSTSKNL